MDDQVVILMSTYNGQKYIRQQLESIINQSYTNLKLLIRDDGSTDQTPLILTEFANNYANIDFINQDSLENKGFNGSFFELIREGLRREPDCKFFAFADQDDVWFKDKILSAMKCIKKHRDGNKSPYVYYYADKKWTDEHLNVLHEDDFSLCRDNYFDMFILPPVYGCTSVISRELAKKALESNQSTNLLYDVYIYRLACLIGGTLISDRSPQMYYRRHGNNASGDAMVFSIKKAIKTYISKPSDMHGAKRYIVEIYDRYHEDINGEQEALCKLIRDYEKSFPDSIRLMTWREAHRRGIKASIMWIGRILLKAI